MKSDVFLAKSKNDKPESRVDCLKRLLSVVMPAILYSEGEIVPIKLTVGDSASVRHIAPEMVKRIVHEVKQKKAKPFLFDTSVIYKGRRQNAVDHMNLAQGKGFGHSLMGAPFIIADGVFGIDGRDYALESPYIKKVRVPSFVGMLNSLVVISHITGHILCRYAGAIKNVAMGMSCRATKQVQHSSVKPSVIHAKCTACGCCIEICPAEALSLAHGKTWIDSAKCLGCGECLCACKQDAIGVNWEEDPAIFGRRLVDVATFILSKFKNKLFINFALDITKECDCISSKDDPIVCSDIGILASQDILALDKATADLMLQADGGEFFGTQNVFYEKQIEYAAEKKLGALKYQLIEV